MGWPHKTLGVSISDTRIAPTARTLRESITPTFDSSGRLTKVVMTDGSLSMKREVTWDSNGFPTAIGMWEVV